MVAIKFVSTSKICTLSNQNLFRSNQVSIPLFEEAQVLGTPDELEVSHHWVCCAVLCSLAASIPLLAWLEQGSALTPPSV